MEKLLLRTTIALCLLIGTTVFYSYESGPLTDASGSPFDSGLNACTESGCHNSFGLNSGSGSITLTTPASYYPGESYTITVTVAQSSPPPAQYGFQTIALRDNNNAGGTYTAGTGTQVKTISGRSYMEHTSVTNTSGTWTFTWNAPSYADTIKFYAAGLAANGNNSTSGDYAYTTQNAIHPIQPISYTRDSTTTSCFGECDGAAAISVTGGGVPPYSIEWSTGDTTAAISGLCGGVYTVTITDSEDHEEELEITVEQPDEIELDFEPLPSSCAFGNGQISVEASGGAGGYSYQWNDSAGTTSNVILNTGIGWFTVTVTDADGCFVVDSAEVETSASGLSGLVQTLDENCGQGNGQANITMTAGNAPYSYSWIQGGDTSAIISGLGAGTYSVMVTDNIGCTDVFSGAVGNLKARVDTDSSFTAATSCYLGSDGTATARMQSGIPPFTFHWQTDTADTSHLMGLMAGEYTFTVTDLFGCMDTASLVVSQPDSLYAMVAIDSANEGFCDGSATLSIAGGRPPYSFDWSHESGLDTNAATELCGGEYLVVITDSANCLLIVNFYLPEKLGINNAAGTALFSLFPNPARDVFTIRGPVETIQELRVTDLAGRCVFALTGPVLPEVDVSLLQHGVYSVILRSAAGTAKLSLIKQD